MLQSNSESVEKFIPTGYIVSVCLSVCRNVEKMLRSKGESVKRYINTEDGTIELMSDNEVTSHDW